MQRPGPSRRLLRAVAASVGDLKAITAALIDAMPDDRTEPTEGDEECDAEGGPWAQPTQVQPGFVVDLVSAASRITPELGLRATERASPRQ
jgi:hypothetical protein